MANARNLIGLGMPAALANEVAVQIDGGGGGDPIPATDVTVAAITADNFSFAGGTLQAFCQAIAEAIPAA